MATMNSKMAAMAIMISPLPIERPGWPALAEADGRPQRLAEVKRGFAAIPPSRLNHDH